MKERDFTGTQKDHGNGDHTPSPLTRTGLVHMEIPPHAPGYNPPLGEGAHIPPPTGLRCQGRQGGGVEDGGVGSSPLPGDSSPR